MSFNTFEILLSGLSAVVGAVASWVAFQRYASELRDRLLKEAKTMTTMECEVKALKDKVDVLSSTLIKVFKVLENQRSISNQQHIKTLSLIKGLTDEKLKS